MTHIAVKYFLMIGDFVGITTGSTTPSEGTCEKVEGRIRAIDWCKLFSLAAVASRAG